jgi:tRNA1(Val) A37 N6-methylase TrmN6
MNFAIIRYAAFTVSCFDFDGQTVNLIQNEKKFKLNFFIMQTLEDLGILNLKIYQDDELYRFTSDSVLLSRFAKVKKGDVVADFCSGSGIVGMHLYALNPELIKSVTLFEMQKPLYELSLKSIEFNNLQDKFSAVNTKVQDVTSEYAGKFSLITCNPPYMPVGSFVSEKEHIAVCRTEIALPLEDLIKGIATSLKFGGRVCMVHRADRLIDVTATMRKYKIEPKRLQFVAGGEDKEPYLFLIEGVLGGKSGLKVLKTITN